ncbi:MAG: sugar phosphate isomerase/epimerase [Bacteroidota bacterium]
MKRREFINTTTLAAGGLLIGTDSLARPHYSIPADFEVTILAPNWGFQGDTETFCARSKKDGYNGIEVWLPRESASQKNLFSAIEKNELKHGLLAGAGGSDFAQHFSDFKKNVQAAVDTKPLFVNCHSGRDYFTFEQNKQFIDFTINLSQQSGIPIYHETHRARILFAAHIARRYFEAIEDLKVTLDISHWTCVAGSLLGDQEETVNLALSRTGHVHSRVGNTNSAQISDPRAPEWKDTLAAHFAWWDKVVEHHIEAGKTLTMTTEFGPPSYMPTLPFTNQPVTDLWAVNKHMKDLWRERYKA